jgi:4,5-DOPA dioxygenase extradiol
MPLPHLTNTLSTLPQTPRMPVLFMGHGSPLNALEDNTWTRAWRHLATTFPHPTAILCISAHWLTEGTHVHTTAHPKTIHDFWGFPEALYTLEYPAPGAPDAARTLLDLLTPFGTPDTTWGLDHGTWVIVHHLFPRAEVPVFQMSIDISKPHRYHYDVGRKLRTLRDHGVLIMGSGNIVHNLGRIQFDPTAPAHSWATQFDAQVQEHLATGNDAALIEYEQLGTAAQLSVPTPDHYWPLLYTLGVRDETDAVSYPTEGIAHSSISMRSVRWG